MEEKGLVEPKRMNSTRKNRIARKASHTIFSIVINAGALERRIKSLSSPWIFNKQAKRRDILVQKEKYTAAGIR